MTLHIRFTPKILLEMVEAENHKLAGIIDLTFTTRYYKPVEFLDNGVNYNKILVPGHDVPKNKIVRQ